MPTSILKTSTSIAKHFSVGFNHRTRVYLVPNVSSYSEEEYDACFTTEADEKRNTNDIVKTITVMRTGSATDRQCEDFCDRGLEHMASSAVARQRKEDRARVIDSVLDEQDDQWDAGYYDGDRLASVSQHLTSGATDLAAMRAHSDAAIARRLNPSPEVQVVRADVIFKSHTDKEAWGIDQGNYEPMGDLTAVTTYTSSTSATSSSSVRMIATNTPLETILASVLSTPDFSTITANISIMAAQHSRSKSIGNVGGLTQIAGSAPISNISQHNFAGEKSKIEAFVVKIIAKHA